MSSKAFNNTNKIIAIVVLQGIYLLLSQQIGFRPSLRSSSVDNIFAELNLQPNKLFLTFLVLVFY